MLQPTERSRVVTATEQRKCSTHGDYLSQQEAVTPGDWHNQWTGQSGVLPSFWTNCPQCNASWEAEANATANGKEAAKRRAAERLAAAGIPPRFSDSAVWNWDHGMDQQRRCWNWARDFCNGVVRAVEEGRGAVFLGAPGTGKTHLAIGVLRHVIEKGGTGHYTTVMGALGRIKDTFNRNSETERQVVHSLTTCDLLVVDEVGRQLDTNYEIAQLFHLLDLRYQNLKPTILVSNMTKPKLTEFLGEAIMDRMREGGGSILTFDWSTQRNYKRKSPSDEE